MIIHRKKPTLFDKIENIIFNLLRVIKFISKEDRYNLHFIPLNSDKKVIKIHKTIRYFIKKYKRFIIIVLPAFLMSSLYFIFYDITLVNKWVNILSVFFIIGGIINFITPFSFNDIVTKDELKSSVEKIIEEKKEKDEENEKIEKRSTL